MIIHGRSLVQSYPEAMATSKSQIVIKETKKVMEVEEGGCKRGLFL